MTQETQTTMTFEQLVAECKKRRGLAETAQSEYFLFLLKAERDYKDVWEGAGCADFAQFLRSNDLADTDKYRFFTIGVGKAGPEAALRNGAAWTCELGRRDPFVSQETLGKFSQLANSFVEANGVAPSEQTVRGWGKDVLLPRREVADYGVVRKASELQKLRAEVALLRAENAALKKRVAELEGAPTKTAKSTKGAKQKQTTA